MFARFVRAVALLLLAGQAIVAQGHGHAAGRWGGAAAVSAGATARSAPAPDRRDDPLDCPICREVAHAGAYLTPGSITFTPPAALDLWPPYPTLPAQLHGQRSHAWRSRAPPVLLHP